ncbi:unnamed protein product [Victoria cruziana]
MDKTCWIGYLDSEQMMNISELLPLQSLLALGMTCRRFRDICYSDRLWESICRREWGNLAVDAMFRCSASLSTSSSSSSSSSSSTSLSSCEGERRKFGGWSWKRVYEQAQQMKCLSCMRLTPKGAAPHPRASHSLNFISDSLVLFGGGCEGGRHLDDTWVAHTGTGRGFKWQYLGSGNPTGRFGQSCTVVADVLVLFGGIDDNGIRKNDTWVGHVVHDEIHSIKISWKPLEVGLTLPPPRGAHAGCFAGERRMVIHGGIGLDGMRLKDTWLLELLDNGMSGTWREIVTSVSPLARSGHTLTYIGGSRIVLFGGRELGYEVLNDVWLLDLASGSPLWLELMPSNKHDIPLPRVGHSATRLLGGRVLIFGGEDSQRRRKDDFWVLDTGAATTAGVHCQPSRNIDKTPRKMWRRLNVEGHLPIGRSFHRTCADRSRCKIYIFGGMVDGVVHPAESSGLRFDAELYLVELVLQS